MAKRLGPHQQHKPKQRVNCITREAGEQSACIPCFSLELLMASGSCTPTWPWGMAYQGMNGAAVGFGSN
jgi:hypothetical protein